MAILSGLEIQRQIALGNIRIDPYDETLVNPNSVDLHLGDKLLRYDTATYQGRGAYRYETRTITNPIDSRKPPPTLEVPRVAGGGWVLRPGVLYLGATQEWTETRGFVPYVDGRSSMGRVGLFCHVTAGRGDNGFKGRWTLELVAVEPLVIYPGQRIAQLTFHAIEGEQTLYGGTANTSGRYQGDEGPTPIKPDVEDR